MNTRPEILHRLIVLGLFVFAPTFASAAVPAFPGAQGGGAVSVGGRGGQVIEVTNLNDSGAGSLRACMLATGPRTCVFRVGGTIQLLSQIRVTAPFLTVAGQTAPGGGIQLSGKNSSQNMLVFATHDVILRYLRVRKGFNSGCADECGIGILMGNSSSNIIIDHVSNTWHQDEGIAANNSGRSSTISWSIVGEAVGSTLQAHPTSILFGSTESGNAALMTDIDVHHNLIMNTSHRNPLIRTKSTRIVNNLHYNMLSVANQVNGGGLFDIIGNKYKRGPVKPNATWHEIQAFAGNARSAPGTPSLFLSGNIGWHQTNPAGDQYLMASTVSGENISPETGPIAASWRRSTPMANSAHPISAEPAANIEGSILPIVGASRTLDCNGNWVGNRDSVDTRMVGQYKNNTGTSVLHRSEAGYGGYPSIAGGTPCTDTDHDGMPDGWETARGLNRNSAADRNAIAASGYTNLEVYLAGTGAGTTPPPNAATQSATFTTRNHPFLGNNHIAADFIGDGKLDLAGTGANSAAVMLNNGDGTFQAKIEYPVGGQTQDLAAGEFNGDGKTDLVVTINTPEISLSLLTGNGDGTFNAPVNFPNTSGFDSPAIVAADLNNDAKLDVVIAHQIACFTAPCTVSRTISVMLGKGNGTFQPTREVDVGTGMSRIAVGDFNRDGTKDLGISGDKAQVYTLIGVGNGTFVQQPTITLVAGNTTGVDGTDIDVADFNRDTVQDLVVAIGLNGSRTAILIGNGDGTFRQPLIITDNSLSVPQYQAVADFNGDAFQDLAIALGDGAGGLMEILNGNGDGTFQPPIYYLVPPPLSSIGGGTLVAGDFNSDGKPDIALQVVGASPALDVLINSTGVASLPTPSAPTLVSPANDATPSQPVTFDWTDVSAATSYRIQIDDSSAFSAPLAVDQTVTVSQFTAGSLAARRHWWRVRGINSAGTAGAWSTVRRFTPQSAPTAPTLSAIALSPSTVVGGNASQGTATLTSAAPTGRW